MVFIMDWTAEHIPDQSGKTVLFTGANTGIGFIGARELAGKHAHVVLAVRSVAKGEHAIARIMEDIPDASLEILRLDLADLASVEAAALAYRRRHDRLDILINNAGVMVPPYTKTADGFELQIGVNHFGHFALTGHLFDLLLATEDSRIVNVSSGAHKIGRIDFEDINWEKRRYRRLQAYADSKLANLLFTFELQRRLHQLPTSTMAIAAHPGVTMTDLQRYSRLLDILSRPVAHDIEQAALPTLRAATDPAVLGGDYFGPGRFFELSGAPERVKPIERALETERAEMLWELSCTLTGIPFDSGSASLSAA